MQNPICLPFVLAGLGFFAGGCQSRNKIGPDTAALVNQTEIKHSEVERVYRNRLKQANQTPSPEEASTLRLNVLSQLINDEMLMLRAAALMDMPHGPSRPARPSP